MSYTTIFANLAGSPATNPASLIDGMFNRVGQIACVPCDCAGVSALTLTPQANTPPITTYSNHTPIFSTIPVANSTGLVTAQVGALALLPVYKMDAVTQLSTNDVRTGRLLQLVFESSLNGGAGGFVALQTLLPAVSGAISGASQIKTTSYTVTNNDKGSTITINNNTQFTVTGTAATGYDSDFQVRIYNGNANAGILINFPGVTFNGNTNNCLYPGQSITLENISGTWTIAQQPGRWQKASAVIFVQPTGGSDTANDGLSATTGMATIQGAYNLIAAGLDTLNGFPTIQLVAGTHIVAPSGITFSYPLVGKTLLFIQGDGTSLATALNYNIQFSGASGIIARDISTVSISGVSFSTTGVGTTFLAPSNDATIDAATCVYFASPSGSIAAASACSTCNIVGPNQIAGNLSSVIVANSGAFATMNAAWTVNGSLTIGTFASAGSCGVIDFSSATFSGPGAGAGTTGTKFSASTAGGISLGSVVLPGNVAGSFTAPGWIA